MATTRLTPYFRDLIRSALLKGSTARKELDELLGPKQDELARLVYDATFTEKERTLLAQMPKNWLDHIDEVPCVIGGRLGVWHLALKGSKLPWPGVGYDAAGSFRANSDVGRAVRAFFKDTWKLEAELRKLRVDIDRVLAGFRSLEALVEAWPEVGPVAEEVIAARPTLRNGGAGKKSGPGKTPAQLTKRLALKKGAA